MKLTLLVNSKELEYGRIEKQYGDYEINDFGIAEPIIGDEFNVDLDELISKLRRFWTLS